MGMRLSLADTYTTRVLPVDEWKRLDNIDLTLYDENLATIMVIERGGEIIARWALMPVYHAEGLWVKEDYRKNPAIIRRLLTGMKVMSENVNAPFVVTMTQDEEVAKLLNKLPKTELLKGDFYAIAFGD